MTVFLFTCNPVILGLPLIRAHLCWRYDYTHIIGLQNFITHIMYNIWSAAGRLVVLVAVKNINNGATIGCWPCRPKHCYGWAWIYPCPTVCLSISYLFLTELRVTGRWDIAKTTFNTADDRRIFRQMTIFGINMSICTPICTFLRDFTANIQIMFHS